MNIFMPEITIQDSVQVLDDKRLIKQILECYQIIQINDRVLAGEQKVGYANHPVVKFYRDKKDFLIEYGFNCCREYIHRFFKYHKYNDYFCKEYASILPVDNYEVCYIDKSELLTAIYHKNITNLTSVQTSFREKLIKKWCNDKRNPKWTRRLQPEWLKIDLYKQQQIKELETIIDRYYHPSVLAIDVYDAGYR